MFDTLDAQPVPSQLENDVLEFWNSEHIFQQSQEKNKNATSSYVIYDGPPTANAAPALHHAIPGSFKDLMGRYQTMQGKYVRRQVGWDTHGLPVEVQVEKALGLSGKRDILNLVPGDEAASIAKFNEYCKNSVWEFKNEWARFVPRIGYWTDTENPYITYDPKYIEKVWGVFRQIWDKELVYKDYKVLPYCPRCGTALSAAEVALEYQDKRDVSVFVAMPLVDNPQRSILAWTTTPWTLPGNIALAVGADSIYVAVRQAEGREYILAKSRLSTLQGEYEILEEMPGSQLVGLSYLPPYPGVIEGGENGFKVYPAAFVTDTDGTGVVHTAVMYGEDDFNLGKEYDLPRQHTVGLDGCFLPFVPGLAGMFTSDALGTILTYLVEKKALYRKETITHSYPHCWRCKTPLLYYAKDSWFIAMSRMRAELQTSNSTVDWVPSHLREGRFGDFISQARDWAVSRERFWGTPLPIWVSEEGKFLCVGSFEELKNLAENPELVGEDFDPHRPGVDAIVLIKDGVRYQREPLVMDVWFDSGSMPYASGRDAEGEFPADYIAEAVDQTRGWFYTLMAIGTIIKGTSPYKRVVCMGHLVDEHGKKMSKSGPNAIKPQAILQDVGADALRWFFYTVNSPGEAKAFNIKEVQIGFRKSTLLIWNMLRFFTTAANLNHIDPAALLMDGGTVLDQWAKAREAEVISQVTTYLEGADFMRAGRLLEEYINDLSTWYLRRSRKRTDEAFFTTFYTLLLHLLQMMAPFTPFSTEKMYQVLRSANDPVSVHLTNWPKVDPIKSELLSQVQHLRKLVETGLAIRAQEGIKVRQPLARVQVVLPAEQRLSDELVVMLSDELNVLTVEQVDQLEGGVVVLRDSVIALALDTVLSDALMTQGMARDVLRQIQELRKQLGLQPGQVVTLRTSQGSRAILEPLFTAYPAMLQDAYLTVDEVLSWGAVGEYEITAGEETLLISLEK